MSGEDRRPTLEKQIQELEREGLESDQIVQGLVTRRKTIFQKLAVLRNQLKQLAPPEDLVITDHAIIRYAERHYQFPIDKIRAEVREKIGNMGSNVNALKFAGFVIKGNAVITYTPTGDDAQNLRAAVRANPGCK